MANGPYRNGELTKTIVGFDLRKFTSVCFLVFLLAFWLVLVFG